MQNGRGFLKRLCVILTLEQNIIIKFEYVGPQLADDIRI